MAQATTITIVDAILLADPEVSAADHAAIMQRLHNRPELGDLLTERQAAAELSMSHSSLCRWRNGQKPTWDPFPFRTVSPTPETIRYHAAEITNYRSKHLS